MEINGGNFDRNIQQAKREQLLMKELGLSAQIKQQSEDTTNQSE
jgi:hypothetical protein